MSTEAPTREPADFERCQADKPNGQGPFTLGGGHKMVRCREKPVWIVSELKPGDDGLMGSMSLCQECREVFAKQVGDDGYGFTPIAALV